jgi:hypothetical protein
MSKLDGANEKGIIFLLARAKENPTYTSNPSTNHLDAR